MNSYDCVRQITSDLVHLNSGGILGIVYKCTPKGSLPVFPEQSQKVANRVAVRRRVPSNTHDIWQCI